MENSIVKASQLSHKYSREWAIRDINLEIRKVGVLGLLGSNGAGKSTTMNILCGVLNQTEGTVHIDGIDIRKNPEEAKMHIGFLPQNAPLHLDLTVSEYLTYCGYLRNISRHNIKAAVYAAMEQCGIAHFRSRVINNLSGGYRQRVGIAQSIIHRPKLVVLDEPTNGLDPNQILEVRKLIKEIATERAVIFSSHILSEVQATCDDIRMIEGGRMVFADTMSAFNNYILPNSLLVYMRNPPPMKTLAGITGITQTELLNDGGIRLHFDTSMQVSSRIIEMAVTNDWQLTEIMLEKSSLDEIFAQLSNKTPKAL
ncbi:MAG: ABC transporter ATP-binding protein [Mucilaginibacter sp.]|uniref:ABC transporter ATP-binding protein n=1 Tax=Mucilaginibacter sp. TaxID=1882438 RepID=UPI0035618204